MEQIIIGIWMLFMIDMTTQVHKYDGTYAECQSAARNMNKGFPRIFSGCFRIAVTPPLIHKENMRWMRAF